MSIKERLQIRRFEAWRCPDRDRKAQGQSATMDDTMLLAFVVGRHKDKARLIETRKLFFSSNADGSRQVV